MNVFVYPANTKKSPYIPFYIGIKCPWNSNEILLKWMFTNISKYFGVRSMAHYLYIFLVALKVWCTLNLLHSITLAESSYQKFGIYCHHHRLLPSNELDWAATYRKKWEGEEVVKFLKLLLTFPSS